MHLILGGRHMGKRAWAESLYGPGLALCDLGRDEPEALDGAELIVALQEGVRRLLRRGEEPLIFFMDRMDHLRGCVLIGDEVGSGVVPTDPFERRWRDETGLLYQALGREADIVDRVWAGLPCRLKGPGMRGMGA